MKCKYCGFDMEEDDTFCGGCGKKLEKEFFDFDEEKAYKAEYAVHPNDEFVKRYVGIYHKIKHKEMQEIFLAWIEGERIPFEYEGLSLEDIISQWNSCSYGQAILEMDRVIGRPLRAQMYKSGELFPRK